MNFFFFKEPVVSITQDRVVFEQGVRQGNIRSSSPTKNRFLNYDNGNNG